MPTNYVTQTSDKSKSTAFWLCVLGGYLGLHLYYVGRIGRGLLYSCTFGLFGIGWFLDIIAIVNGSFRDNVGAPLRN
ncbi:MAG TPA: TM2 domain-containing protein [Anaerolineaceae bacterium]|jgi:restriction system protein|nr:TM2 domain-containing protein [Anaerolineaceae bacterium]HOR83332.1 TM2 domain-containing protein [Anaerolineaceae bacterium]HPL42964.1 TM2 domain-containing protein [Anaerolineaceae bacterium]HPY33253.1 TM2 domain-containing protein [Anaerolineaceae bacterium]HQC21449.1 TM2 domain-containing protein [Anaerolineaceae bacterium]